MEIEKYFAFIEESEKRKLLSVRHDRAAGAGRAQPGTPGALRF